jgi:hypothetical protein
MLAIIERTPEPGSILNRLGVAPSYAGGAKLQECWVEGNPRALVHSKPADSRWQAFARTNVHQAEPSRVRRPQGGASGSERPGHAASGLS